MGLSKYSLSQKGIEEDKIIKINGKLMTELEKDSIKYHVTLKYSILTSHVEREFKNIFPFLTVLKASHTTFINLYAYPSAF